MNDFINIHKKADDSFYREYSAAWCRHRVLPLYNQIMTGIVLVLGILLLRFHFTSADLFVGILLVCLSVLIVVNRFITVRSSVRLLRDRARTLGTSFAPSRVEIRGKSADREGSLTLTDARGEEKTFPLTAICDHFESRHEFYLVLDGLLIVPLAKDGFEQGTCEQFRVFLSTCRKKPSPRAIIIGIGLTFLAAIAAYFLWNVIVLTAAFGMW